MANNCSTPGCGRPAAPSRTICWRCSNHKARYGLVGAELAAKRAARTCCAACGRQRQYMDNSLGKPVCKRCFVAIHLYRQASWREAVERILDPTYYPTR